ncbi:N-acetylmuramoyl-L-alanine amidase family protein, partial [Bacillus mycoides]|uniref:N-acetylmuramoyl-L-alanine amidase family protein n=1 Tax=Bacillus mycoides TaxID=1405 RepID=UPI003820C1EA
PLRGFCEQNGKKYYFGKKDDGSGLAEGKMATGFQTIDGKTHYFGKKDDGSGLAEGQMATGFQTIDGKKYYFGKKDDGSGLAEGEMATGWFQVEEDWYRSNEDGALNKGTLDWSSDKYFFDKKTGKSLGSIKKMGNTYYGYGTGKDAKLLQGFHEFNGKTYYFGQKNDGTGLAEGEKAIWTVKINGKSHYFSGDGSAQAANSWLADYHQAGEPNTWYILGNGEMASGFKQIDGKTYYFDPNNDYRMAKDWFKIGEDWYRAETDGKLNVGILESGSDKYFFDKTTGKSLFSIRSGYHYYGYGPGGSNATRIHGFYEFDGKKYYFGKKDDGSGLGEGQMATNWFKIGEVQ